MYKIKADNKAPASSITMFTLDLAAQSLGSFQQETFTSCNARGNAAGPSY